MKEDLFMFGGVIAIPRCWNVPIAVATRPKSTVFAFSLVLLERSGAST